MEPPGELTTSLRKFGALRRAARNFCSSLESISPVIVIVAASVVAKVAASAGLAGTKVARPRDMAADANPLTVLRRVVMDVAFRGRWFGRGGGDQRPGGLRGGKGACRGRFGVGTEEVASGSPGRTLLERIRPGYIAPSGP